MSKVALCSGPTATAGILKLHITHLLSGSDQFFPSQILVHFRNVEYETMANEKNTTSGELE